MPTGRVSAMTADIDHDPPPEPVAVHEPPRRAAASCWCCWWRAALVAVAVALMTHRARPGAALYPRPAGVLAMVGLFNLFAFAAGIIRFADRNADDPVIGRIADHALTGSR